MSPNSCSTFARDELAAPDVSLLGICVMLRLCDVIGDKNPHSISRGSWPVTDPLE